eukprot:GEMP01001303.1.p1 GENE.GEMP01001303.1~~GEMP01001303.1.p1  ORF type:complete len:1296 (+),score=340.36 GEMP01001303.1:71-3958(+)
MKPRWGLRRDSSQPELERPFVPQHRVPPLPPRRHRKEEQTDVKVIVRLRPNFHPQEFPAFYVAGNAASSDRLLWQPDPQRASCEETTFYKVIGPSVTNSELQDELDLERTVRNAVDGYAETVFAYGQTGSGKTHTMIGIHEHPGQEGVLQRCARDLFDTVIPADDAEKTRQHLVQLICVEIKNNSMVVDLLDKPIKEGDSVSPTSQPSTAASSDAPHLFHKNSIERVSVSGKACFYRKATVWSYKETLALLRGAFATREVGCSSLNSESSRSHMIVRFYIKSFGEQNTVGSLTLVDLAGSESESEFPGFKSNGDAKAINVSLTHLNRFLVKMQFGEVDESDRRQSSLNMMLYDSLKEDCGVHMIFCIHPDRRLSQQSRSTISMASRCRCINSKKRIRRLLPGDMPIRKELAQLKGEADSLSQMHQRAVVHSLEKDDELRCTAEKLDQMKQKFKSLQGQTKDFESMRLKLQDRYTCLEGERSDDRDTIVSLERKNKLLHEMIDRLQVSQSHLLEQVHTREMDCKEIQSTLEAENMLELHDLKSKYIQLEMQVSDERQSFGNQLGELRHQLSASEDANEALRDHIQSIRAKTRENAQTHEVVGGLGVSATETAAGAFGASGAENARASGVSGTEATGASRAAHLGASSAEGEAFARSGGTLTDAGGHTEEHRRIVLQDQAASQARTMPSRCDKIERISDPHVDRTLPCTMGLLSTPWRKAFFRDTANLSFRDFANLSVRDSANSNPRDTVNKVDRCVPFSAVKEEGSTVSSSRGSSPSRAVEKISAQMCEYPTIEQVQVQGLRLLLNLVLKPAIPYKRPNWNRDIKISIIRACITAIESFPKVLRAQRDGALLLAEVCGRDTELKQLVVSSGGLRQALCALAAFDVGPIGVDVCVACFRLLAVLSQRDPENQAHCRASIAPILHAIANNRDIADVVIHGCWSMMNVCNKCVENQVAFRCLGGFTQLIDLLDAYVTKLVTSTSVQAHPDTASLSDKEEKVDESGEKFGARKQWLNVCAYIGGCLASVTEGCKKNQSALEESGGLRALINVLSLPAEVLQQSPSIASNVCIAIAHAAHHHATVQKAAHELQAFPKILHVLRIHPLESAAQGNACRAIATLTESNPQNQEAFLDCRFPCNDAAIVDTLSNVNGEDDGCSGATGGDVVQLLFRALAMQPKDGTLATTVCWALANLCMQNPRGMAALRHAEDLSTILNLLRIFSDDERLCEYGCRLVAELTRGDSSAAKVNRQLLMERDAIKVIANVVQKHQKPVTQQTRRCGAVVRGKDALHNLEADRLEA